MHASLMRRTGAREEITRDNMGHSECATAVEIYSKAWWDERAAAVSAVVDLIMTSDEKTDNIEQRIGENQRQMLFCADSISAPTPVSVQQEPKMCLEVAERIGRP
jgi:hypothetical protein